MTSQPEWLQYLTAAGAIGTLLASLGVLFTLLQNRKQRRATYRPSLMIQESDVYLYFRRDPQRGTSYRYSIGEDDPTSNGRSSNLRIDNIGLGAASHVHLTWRFDLEKLLTIAEELNADNLFGYEDSKDDFFGVWMGDATVVACDPTSDRHRWWPYLLPANSHRDVYYVSVPSLYFNLASSIYALANDRAQERKHAIIWGILKELPELRAHVEYSDIEGVRRETEIPIRLNFTTLSTEPRDHGYWRAGGQLEILIAGRD